MLHFDLSRAPKYSKDFIKEFAAFLTEVTIKYDSFLIVGDFNIHVCCPDTPMVKDFLNLTDSFHLVRCVSVPTQQCGHTLDLVLAHSLPVFNLKVSDPVFSDHMPVLFDISLSRNEFRGHVPAKTSGLLNSSTAAQFSTYYNQFSIPETLLYVEELSFWFHTTCQTVLDIVAPLKIKHHKTKFEPWLSDETCAARRECRRAERRWKKDNLQVSLQSLRERWALYQLTIKEAKRKHFANIIMVNYQKPHILFKSIDFKPSLCS